MVVRLLIMVLNWRSNFQTCPLLQQAGGRRVSRRDSVLAGADVCTSFSSLLFPWRLTAEGFFLKTSSYRALRGIMCCGSCLAFLAQENFGRGPGQDRSR